MASASSDRVEVARAEIQGYADANRVFRIEAYTLARWAEDAESSESAIARELRQYADLNRSFRIQPYTFARWARDL